MVKDTVGSFYTEEEVSLAKETILQTNVCPLLGIQCLVVVNTKNSAKLTIFLPFLNLWTKK